MMKLGGTYVLGKKNSRNYILDKLLFSRFFP